MNTNDSVPKTFSNTKSHAGWVIAIFFVILLIASNASSSATMNSAVIAANNTDVSSLPGGTPASGAAAIQQTALSIHSQTGEDANTVVTALGMANRALGNYADATSLVTEAAQFSLTESLNFTNTVNSLIPVIQQWQITGPAVSTSITQLFGAAAQGKVSAQDLMSTMANTGTYLQDKTTFNEAVATVEALSNQPGMDSSSTTEVFTKFAKASDNPTDPLNQVAGNIATLIKERDLAGAMQQFVGCFGAEIAKAKCTV